jgi:hypothetical protein
MIEPSISHRMEWEISEKPFGMFRIVALSIELG